MQHWSVAPIWDLLATLLKAEAGPVASTVSADSRGWLCGNEGPGATHVGTDPRRARPGGVQVPGPDSRHTDTWRPARLRI